MKQGTFSYVLEFSSGWPPPREAVVTENNQADGRLVILGMPDGSIVVKVTHNDHDIVSFRSRPIRIQPNGPIVLQFVWGDEKTKLYIGGKEIPDFDARSTEPLLVAGGSRQPGQHTPTLSTDDIAARSACDGWMRWRRNRYATEKSQAKEGRRIKTVAELLQALSDAVTRIQDGAQRVSQGSLIYRSNLAAELRAMVHWNGRAYKPLLLLLAGRFDLPLPMYAYPPMSLNGSVERGHVATLTFPTAFIWNQLPELQLVDLQDWLTHPLMFQPRFESKDLGHQPVSVKDLILNFATTEGSGHVDDDVPFAVEVAKGQKSFGQDYAAESLLNVAEVAVYLSNWVLQEASRLTPCGE